MKILFIAEKPDVSRQLRAIYAPDAKYTSVSKYVGYYESKSYIFTAASGHLFTLKEPEDLDEAWKKWDLAALPMELPRQWPLKPNDKGGRYDPATFATIKKLCARRDVGEIVVCTDPDREGQLIWGYIEEMLPSMKKKITRAWFKEWSPESMEACITNRRPNDEYKNLEQAGRCRAIGDAMEGFNDSRAATCRLGGAGNIISIGRVQTFTQHLVYKREKEIKNFVPEDYADVFMETETDVNKTISLKHRSDRHLSPNEAEQLCQRIRSASATAVLHVETKRKTQNVLKLYSTTEIQKDMNKRYGFSADHTSDILQKLYSPEYALTTYPRTDVKEISSGNARHHALNAVRNLRKAGLFDDEIEKILEKKWQISPFVISSQETLAHEAITPVFGSIDPKKIFRLSRDEMKVYCAIVERFLQAFYPKAVFNETTVSTDVGNERFETKGKTLLEPGYLEVVGTGSDVILPKVTDGRAYKILEMTTQAKTTAPPSRYTEASLLEAMENAGRFVDDKEEVQTLRQVKGVGTGATRKETIQTLYKRNYIQLKGKTILPTQKTMDMFDVLPDTPLTSASSTARMEMMLNEIQEGRETPDAYFDQIEQRVREFVEAVKKMDPASAVDTGTGESLGSCPICGGPVVKSAKGWQCARWKAGCRFMIWETVSGKKLPKIQAKKLLETGQTDWISGFRSRDPEKPPFAARLTFQADDNGEIDFTKMKFDFSKEIENTCPKCGGPLKESARAVSCQSCDFILWKSVSGATLTEKDIAALLGGNKTRRINSFRSSKTGKKFAARIYLDEEHKMKFDFDDGEKMCTCPSCSGDVIENERSYFCRNWRTGCHVTIWKDALSYRGKEKISKSEAKRLLEGKDVKVDLVSKQNKPYSAYASFDPSSGKIEINFPAGDKRGKRTYKR